MKSPEMLSAKLVRQWNNAPWLKKGASFDMIHVTVAIEMEAAQF